MHERHSYRLIRDLFAHKEEIFGELKRASALSHTPSGGAASNASRMRAISTDESNRRANMEARNRAIASKSRNSSPAPHANGRSHRRDRSSDPPATRFPIQTSSPTVGDAPRRGVRASLEVPSDDGSSPVVERQSKQNNLSNMINNINNTSKPIPEDKPHAPDPSHESTGSSYAPSEDANGGTTFAENCESLGRSSRFPPRKQGTAGSLNRSGGKTRTSLETGNRNGVESESVAGDTERHGVQLSDKPMDDWTLGVNE